MSRHAVHAPPYQWATAVYQSNVVGRKKKPSSGQTMLGNTPWNQPISQSANTSSRGAASAMIRNRQGMWGSLLREFARELGPLALRRELLIRAPMRARVLRQSDLLEGDGEVEVRVGVERVEAQRLAIARLRLLEPPEIVVDVAEIEMRLEEVGVEPDRALVERLRLGQLVASVMDVREVDQRGA